MKKVALFTLVFSVTLMLSAILIKAPIAERTQSLFTKITLKLATAKGVFYSDKKELIKENEALKKELASLKNQRVQEKAMAVTSSEREKISKEQVKIKNKKHLLCDVVKLNVNGDFFIVINKGKNHGVKEGDIAVWGEALAGEVLKVFSDFSYISPISAPDKMTGVKNKNQDAGLITGDAVLYKKNMCRISYFSENVKARRDDILITSGLSDTFPEGLLIGKTVSGDTVKTEVDFFKIRTLSVLISE